MTLKKHGADVMGKAHPWALVPWAAWLQVHELEEEVKAARQTTVAEGRTPSWW